MEQPMGGRMQAPIFSAKGGISHVPTPPEDAFAGVDSREPTLSGPTTQGSVEPPSRQPPPPPPAPQQIPPPASRMTAPAFSAKTGIPAAPSLPEPADANATGTNGAAGVRDAGPMESPPARMPPQPSTTKPPPPPPPRPASASAEPVTLDDLAPPPPTASRPLNPESTALPEPTTTLDPTPLQPAFEPPQQTFEPPQPTFEPPQPPTQAQQTFEPPQQTFEPPQQSFEPPQQTFEPPQQTFEPPQQTFAPPQPQARVAMPPPQSQAGVTMPPPRPRAALPSQPAFEQQPPPSFATPPPQPNVKQPTLSAAFGDVIEPTVTTSEESVYNVKNHVGSVSMWKKGFRQGIRGSTSAGSAPMGGMALPGMHADVLGEEVFNQPRQVRPPAQQSQGFGAFPDATPPSQPKPPPPQPKPAPPLQVPKPPPPPPPARPDLFAEQSFPAMAVPQPPRAQQRPMVTPAPQQPAPALSRQPAATKSAEKKVDFKDKDYGLVDFDNMMISRPKVMRHAHPSTAEPVKTLNEIAKMKPSKKPDAVGAGLVPPPQNPQPIPQQQPYYAMQQPGVMMAPPGQQYVVPQPGMMPQMVMVPPGAYPQGMVPYGAPNLQYGVPQPGQYPPQGYFPPQQQPRP